MDTAMYKSYAKRQSLIWLKLPCHRRTSPPLHADQLIWLHAQWQAVSSSMDLRKAAACLKLLTLITQIASNVITNQASEVLVLCIRAMVPTLHTANTVGKRSSSTYKVGQEVTGRILDVDAAKKRVSMTLKKLLCSDKLPVITTFQVSFCGCCALSCISQHS